MSDGPNFAMNANMHSAFKREIVRLRNGLSTVNLADDRARAGLVRRYEFFSATLHHHHQGEDRYLWPTVKERALPAEQVVIDAMEAEHETLGKALGRTDASFADLSTASDTTLIAAQLDDLMNVLTGHCAHEERDAVPIVRKYVTEHDLKEFMAFNRAAKDSNLVLPWVCDGATPGEEQSTWGMIPAPVRLFIKPMFTRKYNKFSAACGV
jgi:hemerythrin-like domain-containing protein